MAAAQEEQEQEEEGQEEQEQEEGGQEEQEQEEGGQEEQEQEQEGQEEQEQEEDIFNLIIGQENQQDEVKGGGDNDLYNYSSSNEDELFKSVQKKYKGKRKR